MNLNVLENFVVHKVVCFGFFLTNILFAKDYLLSSFMPLKQVGKRLEAEIWNPGLEDQMPLD